MAGIYYTIYQDNRKNGTKLFYGRAVHLGVENLSDLAESIEHNTTATKGDVMMVLTELVTVMKSALQNGKIVNLDGFGSFRLNMSSKGSISAEDYDVNQNVKSVHCRFLAAGNGGSSNKTRTFNDGVTWKKLDYTKN